MFFDFASFAVLRHSIKKFIYDILMLVDQVRWYIRSQLKDSAKPTKLLELNCFMIAGHSPDWI